MRVAILAWESLHSVAVGGVAVHTSELAKSLADKGHQVHFFTRRMPGQSAHDCIDGVHYHRCLYTPHRDFVEDINNMCRALVDKVFEIEDFVGRFDIVHAHDWLCANALIWIKQGRGHKTVLTIHSTEYARCGNAFSNNGTSVRIREQERAGTFWADGIIAVSEATKRELMWMYEAPEQKISVIGNGVNWRRFDIEADPGMVRAGYGIGPMEPTILFCGRLVWQKGPDILVEAIPGILQAHRNAKFVFVGEGEMRGHLQNRAHHLGVGGAVRFLGSRNGQELVRIYKSSDGICVPSRNEPFGIVVLEAWSARKPVIVTENGGPCEFVRHETNGLKIYPRPDSVNWGVSRLFSDFDQARQMGHNGRLLLEERFSWDKIAEQVLDVYQIFSPQDKVSVKAPNFVLGVNPQSRKGRLTADKCAASLTGPGGLPETVNPQEKIGGLQQWRETPDYVKIEAKIMIPTTVNCEVLAGVCADLTGYGVALQHKSHYLKIRGNWQDVTEVLCQCRKRLQQGEDADLPGCEPAKFLCPASLTGEGAANGCR